MKTLVIIPCFNEQDNIEKLIDKITQLKYDYIIINDDSFDNTAKLLDDNKLHHLDLSNNMGLANVSQIGFKYACDNGYEAAVVVDGDGQHNPEFIDSLCQELENGYDYVVGSRFVEKRKPYSLRMIGSRILCFCIRIKTGTKVTDPTSGMRALGKRVLNDFGDNMNFIAEPDALAYVIHRGYKKKEVQVSMNEREQGESYFSSPLKTMKFMMNVIISILFVQW